MTRRRRRQHCPARPIERLEQRLQLNAPGSNWSLSFDDEFNGTSLDTGKWRNYLWYTNSTTNDARWSGGTYDSYMDNGANLSISGGTAHLTTHSTSSFTVGSKTFNYTQAMITSQGVLSYGYYEIRAKLPTGDKNWPAFWMTNGWPPEDDIMEYWPTHNSATTPRMHQGLYGMDNAWHDYNVYTTSDPSQNQWHTWGMEWGAGYQNFFVDGVQRYSTTTGVPTSGNQQYLLLNSAVDSSLPGTYSNSNNNQLDVDYIRYYSPSATDGPAIANPGWNSTGSWTSSNANAFIVTGGNIGRTGTGDLHIEGAGEAYQTITGLTANTTYTLSGYAIIGTGSTQGLIGVRSYGGNEMTSAIGSTSDWSSGAITFTTGPGSISAVVFARNTNTNKVYFDDMLLTTAPVLAPISTIYGQPNATTHVALSITNGTGGGFRTTMATSSNQTLVTDANMSVSGSTLNITPVANQTGSATITVNITDNLGGYTTQSFLLNITSGITFSGDAGGVATSDTIRLVRNGSLVDVYIDNTSTTPDDEFNYADFSVTNVSGLLSDDTLIVDYSGGDPVTPGGIAWDGGTGTNNVSVTGLSSGGVSASIKSGNIVTIGSDTINYSNTAAMSLNLGSGSNTLTSTSPTTLPTMTINVDSGSTLTLGASSTLPTNTTLNVAGTFSFANQSESVDQMTGAGTVNLGTGTLTIGARGGSSNFGGSITGSGALTKIGAGTFTLSGSNSFTGAVTIGTGATSGGNVNGALRISNSNALAGTTHVNLTDNNSAYVAFQLDGSTQPITLPSTIAFSIAYDTFGTGNLIQNIGGNNTINSTISMTSGGSQIGFLSDAGTLTVNSNFNLGALTSARTLNLIGAGNGQINGILGNGTGGGTLVLSKAGTGNWVLAGSNTYSGSTTVSAGQLTLANNAALGSTANLTVSSVSSGAALGLQGNITIPAGKTFTLNGTGVSGAGALVNVSGNNAWTSALTLNASGASIGAVAGQLTLSAPLSGGALSKAGAGTLVLNGSNSYSNATTVTGGTLEVATGNLASTAISVASGAAVTVDSAAVLSGATALNLSGTANFKNSQTIFSLNGTGVLNLIPTPLTISNGGTFSGTIAGAGSIALTGGTLTLSGSNGFTGGTSASAGQLNVNNADALAGGALTLSNSALASLAPSLGKAVKLSALTISGNAALDVANDDIAVDYSGDSILPAVQGLLHSGYAGGAWTGAGIRSSTSAGSSPLMEPGGLESSAIFATYPATFGGQSVDSTTVLLHYAIAGDTAANGIVNALDFNALASHYGAIGQSWNTGDFNYDGVIDSLDFSMLAANFNVNVPTASVTPSSPAAPLAASLFSDRVVSATDNLIDVV